MLYYLLSLFHVFLCVILVLIILLQSNKGLGLSGAFGAFGGSESVFGSSGSMNILVKITIGIAAVFVISSFTLTMITPPSDSGSIMQQEQSLSVQEMVNQSQSTQGNTQLPSSGGNEGQPEGAGTNPQPQP